MADFPQTGGLPLTIWTFSRYGVLVGARGTQGASGAIGSTAWGTANLAVFIPMHIPFSYPVRNFFWYNFATVAGNADAGIYNDDLSRVVSVGSTAMAGASGLQFKAPATDVVLTPGNYYFALSSDSTTATYGCQTTGSANHNRELGIFQMASGFVLPASATITAAGQARIPLIGITYKTGTPTF